MLISEEGGKPENLEKTLGARARTNIKLSPHITRVWESNPGHIDGRQVFSPLCHPCSPKVSRNFMCVVGCFTSVLFQTDFNESDNLSIISLV